MGHQRQKAEAERLRSHPEDRLMEGWRENCWKGAEDNLLACKNLKAKGPRVHLVRTRGMATLGRNERRGEKGAREGLKEKGCAPSRQRCRI